MPYTAALPIANPVGVALATARTPPHQKVLLLAISTFVPNKLVRISVGEYQKYLVHYTFIADTQEPAFPKRILTQRSCHCSSNMQRELCVRITSNGLICGCNGRKRGSNDGIDERALQLLQRRIGMRRKREITHNIMPATSEIH